MHDTSRPFLYGSMVRLAIVGGLCILSLVLPGFEFVTAVVGCATGVATFTVPAICYLHLCGERLHRFHRSWLCFVAVFGVVGTIFSLGQVILGAAA